MFAVIDCGTTNTRVYILNDQYQIISQGTRRVGVRNTSMTGSKDTLINGLSEALLEAITYADLKIADIEYAIASGMITSEIGLLEIPHLIAPIGLDDLANNVKVVKGNEVLPIDIPIIFVRGIKNDYGADSTLRDIRKVDFMRGEEAQVMGILKDFEITEPVNIIVLSSHTKIIHVNKEGKVVASLTTISGQLYEAIIKETMIGKSLIEDNSESSGGYDFDEIVSIAKEVVSEVGLVRAMMIPRFMQVLLKTDYKERQLFIDASIAVDDIKIIDEFINQGYLSSKYILFGHDLRCQLYSYLIKEKYGDALNIINVSDPEKLSDLTVKGAIAIAMRYNELHN